jgi:hypothetical protein
MQDCQFSAYGVMTKNLASCKSATLRDKWRLRRYLSPDGKVFYFEVIACVFFVISGIWYLCIAQTRSNDRFAIRRESQPRSSPRAHAAAQCRHGVETDHAVHYSGGRFDARGRYLRAAGGGPLPALLSASLPLKSFRFRSKQERLSRQLSARLALK